MPATDDGMSRLDVGDHVNDTSHVREVESLSHDRERATTMVVVAVSPKSADEYEIPENEATVADCNPKCDPDERVYEVVFPRRDDLDIGDCKRYAFPRSRLVRDVAVHSDKSDVGETEGDPD